jgi:hypothetical protein
LNYPFDSPTECSADVSGTGASAYVKPDFNIITFQNTKVYLMSYDTLSSSYTNGNEVTLTCKYWRNPILPEATPGFGIKTFDRSGALIDYIATFTLDASAFTPF